MPLTYLIDEHLRGGVRRSLTRAGLAQGFDIDALQVGGHTAPPLGTKDPALLAWCAAQGRVLVSFDRRTMPNHLAAHLLAGGTCPGIFLIRPGFGWKDVLDDLILLSQAARADEYRDRIEYVPLY